MTVVPWQILTCALAHNWDLFVMCIVSAVVLVVSGILASAVALIVASVVRSEAWAALICLGLGLLAGSAADWFRPGSMSSPLEVLGGGWMAGVLLLQGGDYSEIWTVAPVYLYIAAWSAVLAGRRLLGGESRLLSGPEAAVCLAGWAVAWLPFVLPAGVPDMAANATRELEGVNTMALILLAVAVVPGRDAILAPVRSAARGVAGAISGGAYSTRQCLAWGAAATGVVVAADAARRLVTGVELSWEAAASRGIMLLALVASAILVTEFAMLVLRRFGRQAAMVAVVALAGVYVFVGEFSLGAPEVVFIFPDEVRVYEPVALVLKVAIPPVSLLVLRRLRLNFLGRLFRTAAASERGPAVEAAQ